MFLVYKDYGDGEFLILKVDFGCFYGYFFGSRTVFMFFVFFELVFGWDVFIVVMALGESGFRRDFGREGGRWVYNVKGSLWG